MRAPFVLTLTLGRNIRAAIALSIRTQAIRVVRLRKPGYNYNLLDSRSDWLIA